MTVAPTAGSDGASGLTRCLRRQAKMAAIQPVNRRPRTVSTAPIAMSTASVTPSHSRWSGRNSATQAGIRTAAHSRCPVVMRNPN